jgi:hypothetical protein
MSTSNASDDKISKDKEGHMPDFKELARYIQIWATCHVGTAMTEAQLFCEFFGTRVFVVKKK